MRKDKKTSILEALRNMRPGFTYSKYDYRWDNLKSIAVQAYGLNKKDAPVRGAWFHVFSIESEEVSEGQWRYSLSIACYSYKAHLAGEDKDWKEKGH